MKITRLAIPDVLLLEPKVFGDDRGFFFESFNHAEFEAAVGKQVKFMQDNHSHSVKHVHGACTTRSNSPKENWYALWQARCSMWPWTSAKLRRHSANKWDTCSAQRTKHRWDSRGVCVWVCRAVKCQCALQDDGHYSPKHERCIHWDDADLAIECPIEREPVLSRKDAQGKPFGETELFP